MNSRSTLALGALLAFSLSACGGGSHGASAVPNGTADTGKTRSPRSGGTNFYWCTFYQTNPVNQWFCKIGNAQLSGSASAVQTQSDGYTAYLGANAGVPNANEYPTPFNPSTPNFDASTVPTAFSSYESWIDANAWWRGNPGPTDAGIGEPKDAANAIVGLVGAWQAGANDGATLLQYAREAGDYLVYTQNAAGAGNYPYPSGGNGTDRSAHDTLLKQAGEVNPPWTLLTNGWFTADMGWGGMQYDNGLAGTAILDLYAATGDTTYLASAQQAGDWTLTQPIVPNWNYNAFSVYFLAHLYAATGDQRYLNDAKTRTELGILPNQLQSGTYKGRWADQHNARLVYHYI
ncbi:MAG: hypothetical protein JO103_09910, partial [Candidatus Eremiobacteraeota bacterium]|nr:hypothetical protein [Candidatus Eremiobacteraeota bacterium]